MLSAAPANHAHTQQPAEDFRNLGRLVGVIRDESTTAPLSNVAIHLERLNRTALTDSGGTFSIGRLPPGSYEVTLRHIGYGTGTVQVEVRPRATTKLEIFLPPVAISLDPLEVRVEGRIRPMYLEERGFYNRQEAGWGVFWDPTDMVRAATGATRFNAEGFFRMFGQWDPWHVARRRGCPRPEIYVNGRKDRTGLVESGELSLSEVGAIEVYRDSHGVPVWAFDRKAGCGVVAVWLKRW